MVWPVVCMRLPKLWTSNLVSCSLPWLYFNYVLFVLGAKLCFVFWQTIAVSPCTKNLYRLSAKSTTSHWWRWTTIRSSVNGLVSARLTRRARLAKLLAALASSSRIGVLRLRRPPSFSTTWRSSNLNRLTSIDCIGCIYLAHVSCCMMLNTSCLQSFLFASLVSSMFVIDLYWLNREDCSSEL